MKFEIHDDVTDDYVVIEADTLEEIREKAKFEASSRGWENPWSMQIS